MALPMMASAGLCYFLAVTRAALCVWLAGASGSGRLAKASKSRASSAKHTCQCPLGTHASSGCVSIHSSAASHRRRRVGDQLLTSSPQEGANGRPLFTKSQDRRVKW